jgi:hypothetical protein
MPEIRSVTPKVGYEQAQRRLADVNNLAEVLDEARVLEATKNQQGVAVFDSNVDIYLFFGPNNEFTARRDIQSLLLGAALDKIAREQQPDFTEPQEEVATGYATGYVNRTAYYFFDGGFTVALERHLEETDTVLGASSELTRLVLRAGFGLDGVVQAPPLD